jgi:tetratricopeptide (TPR) repeat protein
MPISRWLCRNTMFSLLGAIALAGGPGRVLAQESDELPLTGPAYRIASEAYEAFGRGDYATAIALAREAIRQRPDIDRLKRLLVEALAASGAFEEADRTASAFIEAGVQDPELVRQRDRIRERIAQGLAPTPDAATRIPGAVPDAAVPSNADAPTPPAERQISQLPPQPDPAYQAADRAYNAYARKDYATAIHDARKAVKINPRSRGYQLLLINALSAGRQPKEAERAATAALSAHPEDGEILAQRGYLRMALRRHAAAADDFAAALGAGPSSFEAKRGLRLALADAALAAGQPQRALAALQGLHGERSYAVAARSGSILTALGRRDEALEAFRKAATHEATLQEKATAVRAEIGLLVDLGRKDEARQRFLQTRDLLTPIPDLDLAYLASRIGDDVIAAEYFRRSRAEGQLKGASYADAAYTEKRLYNNNEAKDLFKAAVDETRSGRLQLDPQQLYGLRREISELERTWGAYSSLLYGAVGVAPAVPGALTPAGGNVLQAGAEIYWRPPGVGYRNGATVEIFARSFETLTDETDGPTGISTAQGSIGARWRPFTDINLVFEASRLFPIGKYSRTDTLLRVAYSDGYGTDLRVDVPDWWTWQIYGDLGYYIEESQTIGTFEARAGHSFRLDGISKRLVLSPFVAVGGGYDSSLATPEALGAGAGLNLRYWFREMEYNAPMSYIDLNIQYRARLAGDERAQGVFAGVTLSY